MAKAPIADGKCEENPMLLRTKEILTSDTISHRFSTKDTQTVHTGSPYQWKRRNSQRVMDRARLFGLP